MYSIYGKQLICLRNKLRLALPNGKIVGLLPNGNRRQMRPKSTTNYLAGYPQALLEEVRQLIAENRLAALLLKKYPLAHGVRTDKALYDYVQELKGQHMRNAGQLSVVSFDGTLQALRNALGSRVQGSKLKAKREIHVAAVFKNAPPEFLRMIVVHELAHLKEREHNKAFYQLCRHMEPNYHQLEFDLRCYLSHLEASGLPLWSPASASEHSQAHKPLEKAPACL